MSSTEVKKETTYTLEIGGFNCVLKQPSLEQIDSVMGLIMPTKGDPKYLKAGQNILNSCWVSGDKEILEDSELMAGACMKAYELIQIKEATLKKN